MTNRDRLLAKIEELNNERFDLEDKLRLLTHPATRADRERELATVMRAIETRIAMLDAA